MLRVFVGLAIDEETRDALRDEVAYLKARAPKVKWVHTENLHITLKFIGEIRPDDLGELFAAVDQAAGAIEPFMIDLEGLGFFPQVDPPRVVWAGCGSGADELTGLAKAIDDACRKIGYPDERKRFSPHLTLGRIKRPGDAQGIEDSVRDASRQSYGLVDIEEIVVYMSELKKSGPVYSPMHRALLGAAGVSH